MLWGVLRYFLYAVRAFMILPAFYDFQYISLVLARTNMAEKPKKKLVPKSRSIEEDKNNWINNKKALQQQAKNYYHQSFPIFDI